MRVTFDASLGRNPGLVVGDDFGGRSEALDRPAVEPQHLAAHPEDGIQRMGDQHRGHALLPEGCHSLVAFFLEVLVADRENLVEKQDLRVDGGRDGKSEPGDHSRRVGSDRVVDELLELGELDDVVDPRLHVRP